MEHQQCIEICNKLLRGELSAIETYSQALEKFSNQEEAVELRSIKTDHIKSANTLKNNIQRMGGDPSSDSGSWGTFVKAIEAGAKLLGDSAALQALKEGEEHGQAQYEEALKNKDVMPECKEMIKNELLPRQIRHLGQLESLSSLD